MTPSIHRRRPPRRGTFLPFCCVALIGFASWSRAFTAEAVGHDDARARPDGSHVFHVQGEFRPTLESARESALRAAQERLREWLSEQNPPINRTPSLEQIRRQFKVTELPVEEEKILESKEKVFKVSLDVTINPEQVRALRQRDHIVMAMRRLGGLLGVLGFVVLLFRVDEWTKGFLTNWLMIAGAGAIIALVILWWLPHRRGY